MSATAAAFVHEESGLERILARITDVAVLPHVVFKVMELSSSTENSSADLSHVIDVDPGFTSKLLSLANSSYYGLPRKVTNLCDAITFLGFKTIRQMAMTVGVYDVFIGKNDRESLRRRRWWRHSVDTAVCARYLARKTHLVPPDEAYTAGLLHYIGKSLLDRYGDDNYEKVELLMEHGLDDLKAEVAVYRCHHIDVGVGAAKQWSFPEELVAALDYSSQPADTPYMAHSACVALASLAAEVAVNGLDETAPTAPRWALSVLEISEQELPEVFTVCSHVIAEAAQIQI